MKDYGTSHTTRCDRELPVSDAKHNVCQLRHTSDRCTNNLFMCLLVPKKIHEMKGLTWSGSNPSKNSLTSASLRPIIPLRSSTPRPRGNPSILMCSFPLASSTLRISSCSSSRSRSISAGVLGLGIVRCGGGGGGSTGDGGRRGDRLGEPARAGERERERDREGECKEGERREDARRRWSIGASLDIREAEMPRVAPLTAADGKAAVGLGGRIPFPGIEVLATLDFCTEDAFSRAVVVVALASLFTWCTAPVAEGADADEDEDPSRGLGGGRIDLASCSFLRLTISALTRCLHFSCWAESSSTLMTCPSPPNQTRCPSSFSATCFASSWLP
jgi:hypothetical protein